MSGKLLPEQRKGQPLSVIKQILKSVFLLKMELCWKTLSIFVRPPPPLRGTAVIQDLLYFKHCQDAFETMSFVTLAHTHSLSVLPSFLIIPASSAMWSFQKWMKIVFWLERLTRCHIKGVNVVWDYVGTDFFSMFRRSSEEDAMVIINSLISQRASCLSPPMLLGVLFWNRNFQKSAPICYRHKQTFPKFSFPPLGRAQRGPRRCWWKHKHSAGRPRLSCHVRATRGILGNNNFLIKNKWKWCPHHANRDTDFGMKSWC